MKKSQKYYRDLREKYLNLPELKAIKKEINRLGSIPLLESDRLFKKSSPEISALQEGFEGVGLRVRTQKSPSNLTKINKFSIFCKFFKFIDFLLARQNEP